MEDSSGWKLFQKRIYDILSHRHGTIILTLGCILVIVSAFQFGETLLEWSEEKYETVFNSFSDNIAGRSYRKRLCLPVPIDVVYTWVNGSDPNLIYELRKHKMLMEIELNQTKKKPQGECTFSNCIPTLSMVIDPALPQYLTKETLGIVYPSLKLSSEIYHIKDPQYENHTVTVVEYENKELLQIALNVSIMQGEHNTTIKQAYYTTDWTIPNTVKLSNMVVLSGFPHTFSEQDLKNHLPKTIMPLVKTVEIHSSKGIAVITMTNKEECDKFIEEGNVTIEGKQQQLNAAYLVWDLLDYTLHNDIAPSRFEDNEEMRYSMRSIEQYAPWVRHIFLVTNGQIPYWLNLDNPRLTLVTHNELFENKSHLPSFSSPSIESHLHKIPGLSDKFIYMNDDVMFGREVWPDDFYTHSKGQKIYLAWPVPNCQDGCPSTWIKDGYCDKACNNSECEWDGGDCTGPNANNQGVGWGGGWNDDQSMYCNSGCANNWLSDRYCDQACNVLQCGFDIGDCGIENYKHLYEIKANINITKYKTPKGEFAVYINTSSLFGPDSQVVDGEYDDHKILRSVSIAQKFNVVTLMLMKEYNKTKMNITLKWKLKKDDQETKLFNFTLTVDTRSILKPGSLVENKTEELKNDTKPLKIKEVEDIFEFDSVPLELLSPKLRRSQRSPVDFVPSVQQVNMTQYMLPVDIDQRLSVLVQQHKEGKLTLKGFQIRESVLYDDFIHRMKIEGKPLMKKPVVPEKIQLQDVNQYNIQNLDNVKPPLVQNSLVNDGRVPGIRSNAIDPGMNLEQQQNLKQYIEKNEPVVDGVHNVRGVQDGVVGQQHGQNVPQYNAVNVGAAQNVLQYEQQGINSLNRGAQQGVLNQDIINRNNLQNQDQQQQGHLFGENVLLKSKGQQHDMLNSQQDVLNQNNLLNQGQRQDFIHQQNIPNQQQDLPNVNNLHKQGQRQEILNDNYQNQGQRQAVLQDNLHNQGQGQALLNDNLQNQDQRQDLLNYNLHNQGQRQDILNDNLHNQGQRQDLLNDNLHNQGQRQDLLQDNLHNQGQRQDLLQDNLHNQGQRQDVLNDNLHNQGQQQVQDDTHKSRKLNGMTNDNGEGLLPWEKEGMFHDIQQLVDKQDKIAEYETQFNRRKLLDHFSDSLRFVNKLYNIDYGYSARKVPAHMPHMIDKHVMFELQAKYHKQWDATSSHRVRHSEDMQFSFSYFYYVMSEQNQFHAGDVFEVMDTDNSGVLSDREIRTLATRLYDLPLDLPTLTGLETTLKTCAQGVSADPLLPSLQQESYYDKTMPQVTKLVFSSCTDLEDVIKRKFHAGSKYKYELANEDEITFKMIGANVSGVVGQLDDVRKKPTKFICLNDNINHNTDEAKTIKAVLQDFYESLFPIPSSFELPREYRNRFLHIDELREWRKYRDWLKLWTQLALFLLIMFSIGSFFSDKVEAVKRKIFGRRQVLDSSAQQKPIQNV